MTVSGRLASRGRCKMIATERQPLSLTLVYGLAISMAAILLIILMRATERFAWWYVQNIEAVS